ncbi:MAG: DUF2975 domain-containing protein [Patescibacteria group bacterium]|nr:DUF2975 domain-containing protein [Patescibacteria group bacterium]
MKKSSTLFLKFAVFTIGLAVLALCVFALPAGIMAENAGRYRYILLGMYIPAIPFYFGLYQAYKLLNLIDQNKAFSHLSIDVLKIIKYCAFVISALYAAGMPYIFSVAQDDDAPGVVAIGLVIIFASFVVAVFAAVLQRLLGDALEIKKENDLTV